MNKVVKGFLIAACVLIILGLGIFCGAATAGGISTARTMAENGELSYRLGRIVGAEFSNDGVHIELENDNDESLFNHSYKIYTSDTSIDIAPEDIEHFSFEVGAGKIVITESDSTDFTLRTKSMKKMQTYVENNTLYIKGKGRTSTGGEIYLEIPRGFTFDEVYFSAGASKAEIDSSLVCDKISVEIGAGEVIIDDLVCKESTFEIGAGNVEVKNAVMEDASVDVGMGNFDMNGTVTGNFDGECGMGNITLNLTGKETDHNYELECAAGNLTVGSMSFSGIAAEKEIDNGATSDFSLECAMGNIEVHFNR